MIIQGDALTELKKLSAESVDCCVTSPPYYRLRDYGCEGQIGLEPTVEEYIDKLTAIFHEVKRVLKADGTLWINIADSYNGSGKGRNADGNIGVLNSDIQQGNRGSQSGNISKTTVNTMKQKDLIGVPWLLAFALRADGWYWRQVDIWEKPNCMPESVKDRCTTSHEYMLLFSKSSRYYFDWEAIQEPCVGFDKSSPRGSKGTLTPNAGRRKGNRRTFRGGGAYTNNATFDNSTDKQNNSKGNVPNDKGLRRKRSVWRVPTAAGSGTHFATFPPRLIEPCILAGSRPGGVVLDPFAGSGTTGKVAKSNKRDFVLIEISEEYTQICRKQTGEEI